MRGRKPKLRDPIMTSIILERDLLEEAKNVANQRGITLSELVRLALISYLPLSKIVTQEQQEAKGGLSAIEIMRQKIMEAELEEKIILIKQLSIKLDNTNKQTLTYYNLKETMKKEINECLNILQKLKNPKREKIDFLMEKIKKYII
ncbi:MAG: hypothetical protein QXO99_08430 [Candidatus Methanomethylicia archaeon]